MGRLGSMVVRIALENLGGYKADLNTAATTTTEAAQKIEKGTTAAGAGIGRMGGAMGGAAGTAVELAASAGLAANGVALLAAGAGVAAYATYKGSQEQLGYQKALILTGNVAGTTASQMQGMAASIDKVVGTQAQAADALAQIAATGQVAGYNLKAFGQVAVEAERVVGTSVEDTAKVFAELGEEPVKASIKLNQAMNYLTVATFEQIKVAKEMGDAETAASLAQNAYAQAMAVRTEQIKGNLGTMERAWVGVKDVAKEAWDSMLGLGRPTDPSKVLDDTSKQIATLRARLADKGLTQNFGGARTLQDQLAVLLEQQGAYQEIERMGRRAATAQAEQVAGEKAKIAWLQEGDKYLTKEEKLKQTIQRIEFEGTQAGADRLEIEKRIAVEREKAADKPKRADNSAQKELEREAALLASLSGVNADYVQQLERLQRMKDKGTLSELEYIKAVELLIAKQPMAKALMDDAAKAAERVAKADLAAAEAHVKHIASLEKGLATMEQDAQKQLEQNERLGLSKTAIAALDAAKLESQAVTLDLLAIKKLDKDLDQQQYDLYKGQAKALRDLAAAKVAGALKETALDMEREIAAERQAGWVETDRFAREAFHIWTDEGEDAGRKIGKSLEKALESAIYQATIRPIAFQIYSTVAGGGGGQTGSAGSGLGAAASGADALGLGASVFGAGGFSGALAGGAGWVTGATTFGGSISAATSLMAAEGGFAAGATMLAGAVLPIVAGLAVLSSVFGEKKWETKVGGAFETNGAGGVNKLYGPGTGAELPEQMAQKSILATQKGINDAFAKLGSTMSLQYLTAGAESSQEGQAFSFAGGRLSSGASIGQFTSANNRGNATPEEAAKALAKELQQVTLLALQAATDIPQAISEKLAGVDVEGLSDNALSALTGTIDTLISETTGLQAALAQWPLESTKNLSFDAAAGLIKFSGGLGQLLDNERVYFDNYLTDDEKRAQRIKNIVATLNAAGAELTAADVEGATRETFKALVKGVQDVETEAGQKTLAALLSVAGAFAEVTDAADESAAASKAAADAQREAADAQRALQAAWSAEGARLDALYKKAADDLLAAQEKVQGLRDEATAAYLAAQKRVTDAQQRVADVLHSTMKGWQGFIDGLDGGAKPTERLALAEKRFDDLAERARAGDTEAMGQLLDAAKPFVELSKAYRATAADVRADQAKVRNVLNEGIAAGQAQLDKLPADMRKATDPIKAAYDDLAAATVEEAKARTLAIAMQASLVDTEKTLGEKYVDAITGLPEGDELKDFFDNTMAAAEAALAIAQASAAAAQTILEKLASSTTTTPTATAGGGTPNAATTTGNVTYQPGLVGGGIYSNLHDVTGGSGNSAGTGTTFVAKVGTRITTDGLISRDSGEYGTQLFWARDVAAVLNDYADANGRDAAIAIAQQYGLEGAMLDQVRQYSLGVPHFDSGIDQVPHDMLAVIHRDEKVFKASDNRELMQRLNSPMGNVDAVVNELRLGRDQNTQFARALQLMFVKLLVAAQATANSTDRSRFITEKWDTFGQAPERAVL